MAWETNTLILPGNYSVAEIEKIIENYIMLNGDYGVASVRYFSDKFFEDEDNAIEFLESLEEADYDLEEKFSPEDQEILNEVAKEGFHSTAVAVKSLCFSKEKGETIKKKICTIVKKHMKDQIEYVEASLAKLKENTHIHCSHCKSVLNTEYVQSEYCPLCEKSMFSEEVCDKISSFDKKISEVANILTERDEKVKTHWCVIFDYHY